jgi:hypothetical protein
MLMLASSSSSPRHRGSIERCVDGGDHRVIGGRAGEMCGNRLQERIALSDRQRRRRALLRHAPVRDLLVWLSGAGARTAAVQLRKSSRCSSS